MTQIYVKYNPYRLATLIQVNGREIPADSTLCKLVKGKRLQEWVGRFPQMLVDELNTVDFDVEFYGIPLDWDDFEDAFRYAQSSRLIKKLNLKFIEGRSDEDITDKVVGIFRDLQAGPVDDFRDKKLERAFEDIHHSEFPINVIATMSSGKSTLINALLGKRLMPSKNEACTATITEILDNDREVFEAVVYDQEGEVLREVPELTYDIMSELNDDSDVHRIAAKGNIPFLDAKSTALVLVDTPGPNNAQNQDHQNTTYRAINNDSNSLILYVLNGTQLSTNDDASLLRYVAEQMKIGGKQVRDRFLFVINKVDAFNPEEEDIGKVVNTAKKYLALYGIEEPQIFPCSAYTALNIRTYLEGIDIDNLTRSEERKLPSAAKDALPMIDKFIDYETMHLEQYTTLSPSAQRELDYRLSQAEKNGDTKEQALIHCGICSIEAAVTAYVKKYAKTKKVKDLVESFWEVLESRKVLDKAKEQVITDENVAMACVKRAVAVKAKIKDGKEAQAFKDRIKALDPMPSIKEKAESLSAEVMRKTSIIFEPYGDTITNREEAKRLVAQFTRISSESIAEMTTELESAINQGVMVTGEQILKEYQEKLTKFDKDAVGGELDFSTVDLIRGALSNMKENAAAWCSDDFASETVDDVGEVSYEEKISYEKVGQEEEEVFDGTEQVKIGTRKVKVGSHKEKTGTKSVKNKDKKWYKPWTWFDDDYYEVDVYEMVDDYKDEDVYETKVKFKTVMRDIYAERREQIERFSVATADIQSGLIGRIKENLADGIESAKAYAEDQIEGIKRQFTKIFDELDTLIQQKYTELEECASDQKTREAELEKSRKILAWIEACKAEIEEILEI